MRYYSKFTKLIIKGIAILVLLTLILGIQANFGKKFKNLMIEKNKYSSYIAKVGVIYSSQKTEIKNFEIVKEKFNKFVNYLESSGIAIVDNLSEKDDSIMLSLGIRKEYFLNLVKYLYDNQASLVIKSLDFVGVQENYVFLNLNLSYSFSVPGDYLVYFDRPMGLKIKFWKEEFERLQNQSQQNDQEKQKEGDIQGDIQVPLSTTLPMVKELPDIPLKYKGSMKIANEKYAIIEYKNKEFFVKEKDKIPIEEYEILLLEINENFIKVNVNNEILIYKIEVI